VSCNKIASHKHRNYFLLLFVALGSKDPDSYNMKLKSKVGVARGPVFIGRNKALVY